MEKFDFEKSLKMLNEMTEEIKNPENSLEESLKYYREGMKCYEECMEMLKNAKLEIQQIVEENDHE